MRFMSSLSDQCYLSLKNYGDYHVLIVAGKTMQIYIKENNNPLTHLHSFSCEVSSCTGHTSFHHTSCSGKMLTHVHVQTSAGLEGDLVSVAVTARRPLNVDSSSACWSNLTVGHRKKFGSVEYCGYMS